jgi:hypothetical protein
MDMNTEDSKLLFDIDSISARLDLLLMKYYQAYLDGYKKPSDNPEIDNLQGLLASLKVAVAEMMVQKVLFQGRQVEGKSVDFLTRKEDFNEYQLTDGKILRIKMVVTRIIRLEEEKTPDGNPVYLIQSQNVVAPID